MDSRHLPRAAYSALTQWLLKLRGVPVLHLRARLDEYLATVPPSRAEELVAPAWLLGRYVEALPAARLLADLGSRLSRLAGPERVADVPPVMEVLSALEQLAAQGRGVRVERQSGDMILSAEAPVADDGLGMD